MLDLGNTDLATNFQAISSRGSDRAELEIDKPTYWTPHTVAALSMLSGDFTSKSP